MLAAFHANMRMLKLNNLPDLSVTVGKVGKSTLDESHSVLNTTQDSSVSSESGNKKAEKEGFSETFSARDYHEGSDSEQMSAEVELFMV